MSRTTQKRTDDNHPNTVDRTLVLLLRVLGVICLSALVPMLMPTSWIHSAHRSMGLGQFPDAPIALFLARSTSALSAFYGGLLLLLSTDVTRHQPIIRYQAVAMLVLSAVCFGIGRHAGLPAHWLGVDLLGAWAFCLPIAVRTWARN